MTDDISMKALSGSLDEIAAGSIEAGCDVVLLCNASLDERRAVAAASGQLSGASEARAARAIAARQTPTEVDIPALEAKLDALISRRGDG
jgi:beta-N-acetylhexosaminidase